MKPKLFRLLRTLALFYILFCMLLGALQRFLIYHPFRESEQVLRARAAEVRGEPWHDPSGAIIGWKSSHAGKPAAANRLVVFHGNAGYALHRAYYFDGFEGIDGGHTWEVLLFEYPGYGARSGTVSESSFIEAGMHALDSLAAADSRPIFLLGESLGSGLASALASRAPKRVTGIFFVTPFASLGGVASHHYGFLPVRLLLRDKWDNAAALRSFTGPAAFLIASEDEVVTAAQGRLLFEGYAGPKRLWVKVGTHNTLDFSPDAPWWREVSDFLLAAPPAHLSPP
jgi:pimeloyl-ACP methyl ester carboxylesterase